METPDSPATTLADYRREVLRRGFRDALAHGQVRPLLLPWCIVPSIVLPALYLALPHDGQNGGTAGQHVLRAARIPLAVVIVALNVNILLPSPWWPSVSSLNFASAYGAGLLAAWGSLWTLTVLVWTDPQRDAERVERRLAVRLEPMKNGQGLGDAKNGNGINDVTALDASVAQSLHDGFAYFWQSFPADRSFLTRLNWAVDLVLNWRGTGWNWCISLLPRFRPPRHAHSAEPVQLDSMAIKTAAGFRRHRSYAAFVSSRLLAFVAGYLVLDIAAVVMTLDPFFVFGSPPDPLRPWSEQIGDRLSPDLIPLFQLPPALEFVYRHHALLSLYRAVLCLGGVIAGLYMFLSIGHLANVLLLGRRGPLHWFTGFSTTRAELWHYPSIFGSLNQLLDHGLAGFWGGFWHQTFRVAFIAPTAWLVRVGLLMPPRTRNTNVKGGSTHPVGLVVAFLQSGFLHAAGSFTSAGRARSLWWQQPLFFALAGVGIAIQNILCRHLLPPAALCLRLRPSRFWRRAGKLLFAVAWLLATHHLFADDLCRSGVWLFEPVPFSPVRWVLYGGNGGGGEDGPLVGSSRAGNSAWRWYADDLPYWHAGEHWWDTGVAI